MRPRTASRLADRRALAPHSSSPSFDPDPRAHRVGRIPSVATPNPVDPPDLPSLQTVRHLLPLWWEQRRLVGFGLACAVAFTCLSLTIPILVSRTIDDAIDAPDHSLLVPYLAAIVAVASVRLVVNFSRRYATA